MDPSSTVLTFIGVAWKIRKGVEMRARNNARLRDVKRQIDTSLDKFEDLVKGQQVNLDKILDGLQSDLREIQEVCERWNVPSKKGPSLWWERLLSLVDAGDNFQELVLILKRIDHAYSKILLELVVKQSTQMAEIQNTLRLLDDLLRANDCDEKSFLLL